MTPVPYHHQVKPLSSEQKELIHRLVYFQDQYETPSEKDMKRLTINNVLKNLIIFLVKNHILLFFHFIAKYG